MGLLWSRIADGSLHPIRVGGNPREGFLRGAKGNPMTGPFGTQCQEAGRSAGGTFEAFQRPSDFAT